MPRNPTERFEEMKKEILAGKKPVSVLAQEYGVSETNVRQVRKKLTKVPPGLLAKQKAKAFAEVAKVTSDTVAERQRLRGELQKLIGQLDPMGPIAIPTKATIIEKVGRLLDSEDRAIAMGRNMLGPTDEETLRARDEAFYDQVKAKLSPAAQAEFEKAVTEALTGGTP